jgi:hypothetical protein
MSLLRSSIEAKFKTTLLAATSFAALWFALVLSFVATELSTRGHGNSAQLLWPIRLATVGRRAESYPTN